MKGMRVLGIDPGLATVGFGLVVFGARGSIETCEWGVITTAKDKPEGLRLQEVFEDTEQMLKVLKPDCVSLERLFYFRNATTIIPVSQARGVITLAITRQQVPLSEYTPMQVKQAMTGYGKAKKPEVMEMVARLLNLEKLPRPDDAADALALALTHQQLSLQYIR
jgi:crossover junction endodeoxyribonuclease RuvC